MFSNKYIDKSDSDSDSEYERKKKRKQYKPREIDIKLPRHILVMPNPDKLNHEKYQPGQNPIRFPTPFRCCIIGLPNAGKSLLSTNILLARQSQPPNKFEEVFIVHGCETSAEYDDIEPTDILTEIPSYLEFSSDTNKLMIIDDYDYTKIDKDSARRLSELVRFGSSHCNMSLIFTYQSFFRLPKLVKDMCNVIILYKPHDIDERKTIGRRVGLNKDEASYLFDTYLIEPTDSLIINMISKAPYVLGKNLYEPIDDPKINHSLNLKSQKS